MATPLKEEAIFEGYLAAWNLRHSGQRRDILLSLIHI